MIAWFGLQIQKGNLRPIDPALLIQGLFGPVFLLIVLGPAVFEELARIGINPAIDNVEAYVDLLLHGAAQPSATQEASRWSRFPLPRNPRRPPIGICSARCGHRRFRPKRSQPWRRVSQRSTARRMTDPSDRV